MINLFTMFAATSAENGPAIHVAPGEVFHIGSVAITNSMIYGWIVSLVIIALMVTIARRMTIKPKGGVIQLVEAGTTFVTNVVDNAFDNKDVGRKYIPYFVTVFFFIMISNWLGLLPGVGEAITRNENPLLRPFTADFNGTLAIGLVTMGVVYTASVREFGGIKKYVRHFFIGSPLNPLYLIIGLLEIFTDLTRSLSLSLRLFLNITIGEIVIAVFTYLGGFVAPAAVLPFVLLEIFVGFLQAYIFVMLSIMYLAIAVNAAHDHHDEESALTEDVLPGKIELQSSRA
jgi:F-type H+-transporting ATPase subunit a